MFGAELAVASLIQAVNDIAVVAGSREEAEKMKVTLLVNKMILTYIFFGIGMFVQMGLRKYLKQMTKLMTLRAGAAEHQNVYDKMEELEGQTRFCLRWAIKIRFIAYPAMRLSASLNASYNAIDSLVQEVKDGQDTMDTIEKWQKTNRSSGSSTTA